MHINLRLYWRLYAQMAEQFNEGLHRDISGTLLNIKEANLNQLLELNNILFIFNFYVCRNVLF